MKKCSKCGLEKPLEDFYKDTRDLNRGGVGRSSYCKECSKAWSKKWYQTSERYRELVREGGLKHRFGITGEEYWELSEKQGHVCRICKEKGSQKYLHVDHDHSTGVVRGLLCKTCNHGLGNFKDSEELLKSAIEYIRDFKKV